MYHYCSRGSQRSASLAQRRVWCAQRARHAPEGIVDNAPEGIVVLVS